MQMIRRKEDKLWEVLCLLAWFTIKRVYTMTDNLALDWLPYVHFFEMMSALRLFFSHSTFNHQARNLFLIILINNFTSPPFFVRQLLWQEAEIFNANLVLRSFLVSRIICVIVTNECLRLTAENTARSEYKTLFQESGKHTSYECACFSIAICLNV